ncbi:MAG: hypothetical protein B0D92_06340 [Spirochaeta sp. LUC14_002_19_P3]|nr:MAG: hypothetical protein B0D92_06340 [Spirochaeta sp. LUC14_002_19_P3]
MADITIPGVTSKYNTTKLVEDLVNAERIRLTRMEEQVKEFETTRTIWQQVNRNLSDLQRSAKTLYGFENPFSDKNALSSNDRILTASAGRTAFLDNYSITVKQTASSDRFLTPSMKKTSRVERGTYTFMVGEKTVSLKYRGGTVEDFARRLSEKGEGIIRASTVRDTADTLVLMIEAVPTGSSNRLQFLEDAREFAIKTGMMRLTPVNEAQISPASLKKDTLETISGTQVPESSVEINDSGILVQPESSLRLPLDKEINLEDGMVLEYAYRTIELNDEDLSPPMPPGPKWPDVPDGRYNGITIRSSPGTVELPQTEQWEPPKRVDDWFVFKTAGKSGDMELPPIASSENFKTVRIDRNNLPESMDALLVENNNTHRAVEITDIRVFNPARGGDMEPAHAVDTANDAIIEFRGIEVTRPSNTVDDLIDGLTLNLKRASSEPVEVSIEPDTETAKEGIIRFVFSYNQMLAKILVLTNDDQKVIDELSYLDDEQRVELEEQLGHFRGDSTLIQVKNRLQTLVTNPYPTSEGATLLAQIGISTNASSGTYNNSLDYSKLRGYLEIDEEKLDSFLSSNIDVVKDLFGMDTTGDLVINDGIARSMDYYLTPYTQTGGITNNRIAGIDRQIKDTEEDITDYKKHLEDYETDLKRQYGTMESVLSQLENSSRELDNFTQRQSGSR